MHSNSSDNTPINDNRALCPSDPPFQLECVIIRRATSSGKSNGGNMVRKCSMASCGLVFGSGCALSSRRAGAHPFTRDEEAKERLEELVEESGRLVARDAVERFKWRAPAATKIGY